MYLTEIILNSRIFIRALVLRTPLFWVHTKRVAVIPYWPFGTT